MFPATIESLQAIIDLAPDAILVFNPDGRIAFANAQAAGLFGYPVAELVEAPLESLLPERFRSGHGRLMAGFVAEGRTRAMGQAREILGLRRDGQEVPLDIKLSPISVHGGSFVIAVVRDITGFRSMELQLRESLEALAQLNGRLVKLNEEKNQLLGTAAHDLRNPLHALLTATEVLILMPQDGSGPDGRGKILAQMQKALHFMAQLVDGLLDLSAIEAGKLRLDLAPLNVVDKLQESAQLMGAVAREKGIELDVSLPEGPLPIILADPSKFLQILNNLLGNAIKFTQEGGHVRVWVQCSHQGVEVFVADEGPGIPPGEQELIFKPFEQGEGAQGKGRSVGLGLAIVERIVKAHQGTIRFETEQGKGTIFSFWFPEGV